MSYVYQGPIKTVRALSTIPDDPNYNYYMKPKTLKRLAVAQNETNDPYLAGRMAFLQGKSKEKRTFVWASSKSMRRSKESEELFWQGYNDAKEEYSVNV